LFSSLKAGWQSSSEGWSSWLKNRLAMDTASTAAWMAGEPDASIGLFSPRREFHATLPPSLSGSSLAETWRRGRATCGKLAAIRTRGCTHNTP
jgi:hypothetical protein